MIYRLNLKPTHYLTIRLVGEKKMRRKKKVRRKKERKIERREKISGFLFCLVRNKEEMKRREITIAYITSFLSPPFSHFNFIL